MKNYSTPAMTITRFKRPVRDMDGKTIYGMKAGRPIYNPDFKFPKALRRPGDTWVCEKTDTIYETKNS